MKKFILYILIIFSILKIQVLTTGCANIVPPAGGPRDSLPPLLVKASPANDSRNFSEGRINFSFDEYIDLDNAQQNLIVSPVPENIPTVTRKLNTLSVKLRDSLEANTTYAINFGKSIKDVNEGNVLKDFTYVFSTGSYIDSLRFSGRVLLAETGETDSTLTIMLHRNGEDSAVINERPRYVAKTDGKGRFTFKNLPPGTFYVYALKDEGGSYRYLNPRQLFAFAGSAITVGQQTDSVFLYAYTNEKPVPAATASVSRNARPADKRLKFQTNLGMNKQDLLEKFVFTFETPLRQFDSSKIHLTTDSTYTEIKDYHWEFDSTMKKATLNYNWEENILYHFILEKDFATDTLGRQLLKADTLHFFTRAISEYGKLLLRFRNLDLSKNPVLIFVQGNSIVKSFPLTSEVFSQPLFLPGEYNLRILYDDNKNGVWDPGEFFGKHKQPELVRPVERKITVRPNWGDETQIAL